jgi:hypothetical protein
MVEKEVMFSGEELKELGAALHRYKEKPEKAIKILK